MRAGDGDSPHESVLQRANLLLDAFGPQHRYLTLSSMVMRTGLPKSTVHRTAQQMTALGWLTYENGKYSLGTRMVELAGLSSAPARAARSGAAVHGGPLRGHPHDADLGIRKGHEVLYIEKIGGHDRITELSHVGGRMPLYCTAIGKSLLAFSADNVLTDVVDNGLVRRTQATITSPTQLQRELAAIADSHVSFDREESSIGVCCVAAPILRPDRTVVGALSVTGRVSRHRLDRLAPAVVTAALGVSRSLAGQRRAPRQLIRRMGATAT